MVQEYPATLAVKFAAYVSDPLDTLRDHADE